MIAARRLGVAALLIFAVLLLAACGSSLRDTSLAEIEKAEAAWQAQPVLNYRMITEISRPGEQRRYEIVVTDGIVSYAVMELYDVSTKTWQEPFELNESQAFPFTVPGMFDIVREALRNSDRTAIRVQMGETPPFPVRIELGMVSDQGKPVRGTETEIQVRLFEVRTQQ